MTNGSFEFPVVALKQGCVHRNGMLCHSALGYCNVLEPCLHEQVARSSEIKSNLEEIAKYVLTILLGNVSRMLDFVYFLLMFRCSMS